MGHFTNSVSFPVFLTVKKEEKHGFGSNEIIVLNKEKEVIVSHKLLNPVFLGFPSVRSKRNLSLKDVCSD